MSSTPDNSTVRDLIDTTAANATIGLFTHLSVTEVLAQLNLIETCRENNTSSSVTEDPVNVLTATCKLSGGSTASLVYSADIRASADSLGLNHVMTPSATLLWGEMTHGQLAGRSELGSPQWSFDIASAPVNASALPPAAQQLVVSETEFWADEFDAQTYAVELMCVAVGASIDSEIDQVQHRAFRLDPEIPVFENAEDFAAVLQMAWPHLAAAIEQSTGQRQRALAEFAASIAIKTALNGWDGVQGMTRAERWQHYRDVAVAADAAVQADAGYFDDDDEALFDGSADLDEHVSRGEQDRLRTEQNAWLATWFALDSDDYTACVGAVHGLLASVTDEVDQATLAATLSSQLT